MNPLIGIVDDDDSILRALRRLLGSAGFRVRTFRSGEELLDREALDEIDCLVLDIHLGGLSGFELKEKLSAGSLSIPVIFITAHDDAPTRERARLACAVGYLRKPFDERALTGAIQKALGRA